MNCTGSCSLIIRGNLDIDEVTKNLGVEPTAVSRKGEVKSKTMGPIPMIVGYMKWRFAKMKN